MATKKLNYVAEFKCISVMDGILHIQITNVEQLWDINTYYTAGDEVMELIYRSLPSSTVEDNHKSIDKIWRVKDIIIGNISDVGQLYIRVPVYLHNYTFEFSLQTKNTSNNEWWPKAASQTIIIPSFLSEHIYSVGDTVSFCNPLNCRSCDGVIKDILNDGNYTILYQKYDETKGESHPHEFTVHASVLYRNRIECPLLVQICDDTEMMKDLLIQSNDKQHMHMFDAIKTHYEGLTQDYCFESYGFEEFVFYWESMADFVTKNICEYLFNAQCCYNVDCLFCDDGVLELCNMRVRDIKNDYEMLVKGVENICVGVDSFDDIDYSCNLCRCCLKEWDYVYSCGANEWDQVHDFCLLCVHTVIQLNQQLAQLLSTILKNKLDIDCIQTIVHYTIGRAVYMEGGKNKNTNSLKRKLQQKELPDAKRRKLNYN